ncbi:MAG TPA: lysylphosphatidylglycerol synthase transmembrane domain-containing protein [Candidatus Kapabacteria bacterium]|jgi:glycosyltransferase 2 family protein|nr:lysylphosphatidylglycerol synthase transmembrane domain-containing protein [Candidatus Kapabacteria bacterium]
MLKQTLRYAIAIAIAAVALYFAFRGTDFDALKQSIGSAHLLWILLGVAMQFLSHLLRAWRWQLFLIPVKSNTSLWNSFKAIIAGYGMNNLIPRAGEIVRPVMFARREKIPIPATIATIVIERVSDLFGMVIFGLASLFLFQDQLEAAFPGMTSKMNAIFGVTTILLAVCIAIFANEHRTAALIRWMVRPLPARFKEKVHHAGHAFAQGMQGIKSRAFTSFVVCTVGIWCLYALSMYFSFFAFDEPAIRDAGIVAAIMLQFLSGIAFIVPTPGGTGSYHAILSQALIIMFGVSKPTALAYVTLTHGANYISTTLMGLWFMFTEGVSMSKLREEAEKEKALELERERAEAASMAK